MLKPELVFPKHTAVLVTDMQFDFCAPKGKLPAVLKQDVGPIEKAIPPLNRFLEEARRAGVHVIFVRMDERTKRMALNAQVKKEDNPVGDCCIPGTKGFEYYKVRPRQGDSEVVKKTYDAMSSAKLREILRKKKIKSLVLTGVFTHLCVDSTARSAFTKGYHIIIPRDLVAATKECEKLHNASLESLGILHAHVTKASSIANAWKKQ